MMRSTTSEEVEDGGVVGRWTTWEELLLGAAVLRHGSRDWDRVSLEVHCRIGDDGHVEVAAFTAERSGLAIQACKAKYEELRKRYSGCVAWFEELRMQRMMELRQEIQQSESSIGSLEYKLETLKAEQRECYSDDSSRTVSEEAVPKLHRSDSFQKDLSPDTASSDSLTRDVSTNCSVDGPAKTSRSPKDPNTQQPDIPQCPNPLRDHLLGTLEDFFLGGYVRKKRGKRKRKGTGLEVKEGSVGENVFVGLADIRTDSQSREILTFDNTSAGGKTTLEEAKNASKGYSEELMRLCDTIMENKCAAVFLRRLNCQKRGRYKKAVRQHMDFQTIRSRITSGTTTLYRELFRDILLLVNNTLVFYSKNTREYKSGTLLRDVVGFTRRQIPEEMTYGQVSVAVVANPPSSPTKDINNVPQRMPHGSKKSANPDAAPLAEESRSAGKKAVNEKRRGPPPRPRKGGKQQRTTR